MVARKSGSYGEANWDAIVSKDTRIEIKLSR